MSAHRACLSAVAEVQKEDGDDFSPIAWIEKGDVKAGLVHILFRRAGEFIERGTAAEEIPELIKHAVTDGKIIGYRVSGIRARTRKGRFTKRCTTE
ncbi:hypothetical protein ACWD6P_28480 [Streptomyces sp. NPDC002446]